MVSHYPEYGSVAGTSGFAAAEAMDRLPRRPIGQWLLGGCSWSLGRCGRGGSLVSAGVVSVGIRLHSRTPSIIALARRIAVRAGDLPEGLAGTHAIDFHKVKEHIQKMLRGR